MTGMINPFDRARSAVREYTKYRIKQNLKPFAGFQCLTSSFLLFPGHVAGCGGRSGKITVFLFSA